MRSLKSRKQFKHRKRQSSKKRMKNKKRKLSKRLRGGVTLYELYKSMEQPGDEIKISNMSTQTIYNKMEKMKNAIKKDEQGNLMFSAMDEKFLEKFIEDGDPLVNEANFRQKQTPEEYKEIRSDFFTLLDKAESALTIKKKIDLPIKKEN